MTHADNYDAPATRPAAEPRARPGDGGDDLLARVESTVAAIGDKLSPVPQLERSLRRWRVGFFLLGAVAAGVVGIGFQAALPVQRGADAVAALLPAGADAGFLVATSLDGHDLVVRRLTVAPTGGHAHQLWLIPADGTPVAVGALGDGATTRLPRPAALTADAGEVGFAISLEPAGAAPARPGVVLYTGRLAPLRP